MIVLGCSHFSINGRSYERQDITLNNKSGNALKCSHYQRAAEERDPGVKLPCVIYLHGNSSSRMEALPAANILLPMDISVFSFDFSGCGKSGGEWVTLGYKERDDLQTVIDYLRAQRQTSMIGLWGRSMGAVTSIFFAAKDPGAIACMVLDSPFSHLNRLTLELANTHSRIPSIIAKIL